MDAVLQQECEIAYSFALESYTQNLKQNFMNRADPFDIETLFSTLKVIKDKAIDEFALPAEVREKYKDYDEYLNKLETYISKQEETIINVNETLAEKYYY